MEIDAGSTMAMSATRTRMRSDQASESGKPKRFGPFTDLQSMNADARLRKSVDANF